MICDYFSHDLGIVLGWIWHHPSMILRWFSHDSDMIFWWFSNDFDDVLEWSQKHSDQVSAPVLEPLQNRSYRPLVNRNPGFRPRLRSWYRPEDPRPTSLFMGSRKVPVLSRWIFLPKKGLRGLTWCPLKEGNSTWEDRDFPWSHENRSCPGIPWSIPAS